MENKISEEYINDLINRSDIEVKTVYDKVTLVTCKLPNGFVLVESSGAVSKENYDLDMGKQTCMEHIKNELWKLEGYSLANKLMGAK
ncbi:Gp49 family protein [Companilactobacillus allii]|uniref:Phage protein n=1 Tax=Companilactobacillus allii TaxID=1847728 RepID=A0A1P8Q2G5_9LACO|nr:Gp49 family protein [Companilactobacillus allii]APX72063.1 hypothetical protein BTM29_05575 [Companilactobacillus allii]USQ69155.1 Gp49 family protein [Companilactobacillus allii]